MPFNAEKNQPGAPQKAPAESRRVQPSDAHFKLIARQLNRSFEATRAQLAKLKTAKDEDRQWSDEFTTDSLNKGYEDAIHSLHGLLQEYDTQDEQLDSNGVDGGDPLRLDISNVRAIVQEKLEETAAALREHHVRMALHQTKEPKPAAQTHKPYQEPGSFSVAELNARKQERIEFTVGSLNEKDAKEMGEIKKRLETWVGLVSYDEKTGEMSVKLDDSLNSAQQQTLTLRRDRYNLLLSHQPGTAKAEEASRARVDQDEVDIGEPPKPTPVKVGGSRFAEFAKQDAENARIRGVEEAIEAIDALPGKVTETARSNRDKLDGINKQMSDLTDSVKAFLESGIIRIDSKGKMSVHVKNMSREQGLVLVRKSEYYNKLLDQQVEATDKVIGAARPEKNARLRAGLEDRPQPLKGLNTSSYPRETETVKSPAAIVYDKLVFAKKEIIKMLDDKSMFSNAVNAGKIERSPVTGLYQMKPAKGMFGKLSGLFAKKDLTLERDINVINAYIADENRLTADLAKEEAKYTRNEAVSNSPLHEKIGKDRMTMGRKGSLTIGQNVQ